MLFLNRCKSVSVASSFSFSFSRQSRSTEKTRHPVRPPPIITIPYPVRGFIDSLITKFHWANRNEATTSLSSLSPPPPPRQSHVFWVIRDDVTRALCTDILPHPTTREATSYVIAFSERRTAVDQMVHHHQKRYKGDLDMTVESVTWLDLVDLTLYALNVAIYTESSFSPELMHASRECTLERITAMKRSFDL